MKNIYFEPNEQWCFWQGKDDEGIYCTAHIHEDRVPNCPYHDLKERNEGEYPCSDYKAYEEVG